MKRFTVLFAAAGLACASASAQVVYRCGSEYTRTPCVDGTRIDVTDTVTPERVADAERVAQSERRLAEGMARDRRAEAALHPLLVANRCPVPRSIAAVDPAKKAKPHGKARKKAGDAEGDGDFIARVPKSPKAKPAA